MLIVEIVGGVFLGYVILILLLETVIWRFQPDMDGGVTLKIKDGETIVKRKLYGLEYNDRLYLSSNHWFRKWYHTVLENPALEVERAGEQGQYIAVPVKGEEHLEVAREYSAGFVLKFLCGFAPQRFLRLDPKSAEHSEEDRA